MRVLGSLLTLFLILLGIVALLPLLSLGIGLVTAVFCLALWFLPFWIIATSDQTTGGEKICWLLAMVFLSWFAWIFYFFLAPLKPLRHYGRDRYYRDDYYRDYDY